MTETAPVPAFDWRSHKTGPPMPCQICERPAISRDADGRPAHKTCAERAAAGRATNLGTTYGRAT